MMRVAVLSPGGAGDVIAVGHTGGVCCTVANVGSGRGCAVIKQAASLVSNRLRFSGTMECT